MSIAACQSGIVRSDLAPAVPAVDEWGTAQAEGSQATLRRKFPPRPPVSSWPATERGRAEVHQRLTVPPFVKGGKDTLKLRRLGIDLLLAWLEDQPGATWQQRWNASGAEQAGRADWISLPVAWDEQTNGRTRQVSSATAELKCGIMMLICGDIIRPSLPWLLSFRSHWLRESMRAIRDPSGFARLLARAKAEQIPPFPTNLALNKIVAILAAKGGTVDAIRVGDCVELLDVEDAMHGRRRGDKAAVYQLLQGIGVFPADSPATVRAFRGVIGQRNVEELVDAAGIICRPIRDLFVDYLNERRPVMDYGSLKNLAWTLTKLFWRDLEVHHPGIDSLRLEPDVATAWKQRVRTKTIRVKNADSHAATSAIVPRANALNQLVRIRGFYLDIAQWAAEDPARWGPRVAPCPITASETSKYKELRRRKARMDQRTRERLPLLPALVSLTTRRKAETAAILTAAKETKPGEVFTACGRTLRRSAVTDKTRGTKVWGEDLDAPAVVSGWRKKRRDLTYEEHEAFWAWAAVEVLRHSGIRIEELGELSHHCLVQYKLPSTGEVVPLLQVAPSKLDEERLLLISPELADVLSQIILRVRDSTGAVPLVPSYDIIEKTWNPPMPLLFQQRVGTENRDLPTATLRRMLNNIVAAAGFSSGGQPVTFTPHDFRRIFITDAIMNGLPPHIAQIVAGHHDINTTMGYKAVYPMEAIEAHRAFIARRRAMRPSEEYRSPTAQEWDEFLAHFVLCTLSSRASGCVGRRIRGPVFRAVEVGRFRRCPISLWRSSGTTRHGRTGSPTSRAGWLPCSVRGLPDRLSTSARRRFPACQRNLSSTCSRRSAPWMPCGTLWARSKRTAGCSGRMTPAVTTACGSCVPSRTPEPTICT